MAGPLLIRKFGGSKPQLVLSAGQLTAGGGAVAAGQRSRLSRRQAAGFVGGESQQDPLPLVAFQQVSELILISVNNLFFFCFFDLLFLCLFQ